MGLRLNSFQELRKHLLESAKIVQLVELPFRVFAKASVTTGIFVHEKGVAPEGHRIEIVLGDPSGGTAAFQVGKAIPQTTFLKTFQNVFDLSISAETESIKDNGIDAMIVSPFPVDEKYGTILAINFVKALEEAKEAKKELETETDEEKRFEIEKQIAKYNILQNAKKVCLNSAYGALGSKYFRFFDVRQASATTTAGHLAIQWIQDKLNSYLNKILETDDKDYIIASDTDSVYLNSDELVRKTFAENSGTHNPRKVISFLDRACESKIQPFIDKSYKELAEYTNALNQKMHPSVLPGQRSHLSWH